MINCVEFRLRDQEKTLVARTPMMNFAPAPGDLLDMSAIGKSGLYLVLASPVVHKLHGTANWVSTFEVAMWDGTATSLERAKLPLAGTLTSMHEMLLERLAELLDVFKEFRSSN